MAIMGAYKANLYREFIYFFIVKSAYTLKIMVFLSLSYYIDK